MSAAAQQATVSLSAVSGAHHSRQRILALALLWTIILAASSILALRQTPYSDAEKDLRAYQQFWYPWENHPLLRLPFIDAAFQDVFVLPSNDQSVWAVADGGLILHSQNGGLSWTRQMIDAASTSSNTAPKAQLLHWKLWSEAVAMDAPVAKELDLKELDLIEQKRAYEQKRASEPVRTAAVANERAVSTSPQGENGARRRR